MRNVAASSLAFAAAAMLSLAGCSSSTSTSSTTPSAGTPPVAATSNAVKSIPVSVTSSDADQPALADVDCGPITGGNGETGRIIAVVTKAGRVGCTDAIDVATAYVETPRTGDAATVDGWTCEPQPDKNMPHACFKDGVTIGIRGGAAPARP